MKFVLYGNFIVDFTSESHHAKSLESLGHEVVRLQETTVLPERVLMESLEADCLIWIHSHSPDFEHDGMERVLDILRTHKIPTIAYHLDLYMPIPDRWQQYKDSPYMNHLQYFFTVDRFMADWLNENTITKGVYLPPGVYDKECYAADSVGYKHDVVFIGSRGYHASWGYRPKLINFLENTYSSRFALYGNDGLKVVRGAELNQVYADSKVSIGDTYSPNFDYPYYFSDRLFESTGRGGFTIFPYIKGIEDNFEIGKEIVTYEYDNFEQLKELVDYYCEHDDEREQIRKAGHERTKKDHTYVKRWEQILKELGL